MEHLKAEVFYTEKEAAQILKVHPMSLARWRCQFKVFGRGPRWVKQNGRVRYPESSIAEYQQRLKAEAGISEAA